MPPVRNLLMGTVFLEPSLRTRLGFEAAAARLGIPSVGIDSVRSSGFSSSESITDTLRVIAGYVDLVVARVPLPLAPVISESWPAVVINGGDGGAHAEHPTQALIDLFAMHQLCGPIASLRVGLCGDTSMRSARSLLHLLSIVPPRSLRLLSPPSYDLGHLTSMLGVDYEVVHAMDLRELDVLYVIGMPHDSIPIPERERFIVDGEHLATLPEDAIILSPLPIIDEISPAARVDPRVRFFDQSDLGLAVRMAVLSETLDLR